MKVRVRKFFTKAISTISGLRTSATNIYMLYGQIFAHSPFISIASLMNLGPLSKFPCLQKYSLHITIVLLFHKPISHIFFQVSLIFELILRWDACSFNGKSIQRERNEMGMSPIIHLDYNFSPIFERKNTGKIFLN